MQTAFRKDFLLLVVGAVAGWLGHLVLANREAASPEAVAPALVVNPTVPSEPLPRGELRPGAAPDQTAAAADEPPPVSTKIEAGAEAGSSDADSTPMILSPLHSGESEETDSHKQADATDLAEKARDNLKKAMMIRCEFKPGATGYWQNQNLSVSLFEWQGGPVTFEVVDLSAGTARMLGVGATGSQDGVIDVMVTGSGTGLHFSAFTPTRVLVVATVFANLDATGRYRAVMSRHGTPTFYETFPSKTTAAVTSVSLSASACCAPYRWEAPAYSRAEHDAASPVRMRTPTRSASVRKTPAPRMSRRTGTARRSADPRA